MVNAKWSIAERNASILVSGGDVILCRCPSATRWPSKLDIARCKMRRWDDPPCNLII
jgi:hypothetical protein